MGSRHFTGSNRIRKPERSVEMILPRIFAFSNSPTRSGKFREEVAAGPLPQRVSGESPKTACESQALPGMRWLGRLGAFDG